VAQFSLRNLLAFFAVIAVLFCLIVKLIKLQSDLALEAKIVGGLQQISAALYNQKDSHKDNLLPQPILLDNAGRPLSSWRLKTLCRVTSPPTTFDLGSPWNAAVNRSLAAWPCWVYCFDEKSSNIACETNLFAITGRDTAFNPEAPVASTELDADVVVVMDVANSGVHWIEPGDYQVSELTKCSGTLNECVNSIIPNRIYVLFADGEIWRLSGKTPMERIKPFFTLRGAKNHSRSEELNEYCLDKWKTIGITSP